MVRRQFIQSLALLGASPGIDFGYLASLKHKKYNIGACDWSLGQNSKLAAFDVAKSIGLDGIQVNLGTRQDGMHLRNKTTQIQLCYAILKNAEIYKSYNKLKQHRHIN